MLNKFSFSIVRPGGNDTAIIDGFVPKSLRRPLNDKIIKQFPSVEQCGFYQVDIKKNLVKFSMLGGEFSGNAMLAITYLVLKGTTGKLKVKSSGYSKFIDSGIKNKIVYTQIPIYTNFDSVKLLNKDIYLVKLKGINHLVVYRKISVGKVLKEAKKLLDLYNLANEICSGCIFAEKENKDILRIDPVVWIRDVKTLTYETACGSGSVAVGLSLLKNNLKNKLKLKIKQPSRNFIIVKANKSNKTFTNVQIEGKVELLARNQNIYL